MTGAEGVEKVRFLFQPDILLPAQYLDGIQSKSNMTPEKRLMLAVLTDALCCLQNYYFRSYNYGKTVFEEAESWITDDDAIWAFSFRSICDYPLRKREHGGALGAPSLGSLCDKIGGGGQLIVDKSNLFFMRPGGSAGRDQYPESILRV